MTRWQQLYRQEARILGEVGAVLRDANLPTITVRVPRGLAEQAVASWEREYEEGGHQEPESAAQRIDRHRAGTLALICLCIADRGDVDGDAVIVDLGPELIGVAMDAADDLPPNAVPGDGRDAS